WAERGEIILIRPESFVANPLSWLGACSDHGATFTAAPPFAFDLVVRHLSRAPTHFDLRSIRTCITGAEPIRGAPLRSFEDSLRAFGWSPTAITPAYGLAEVTLAASMSQPDRPWTSARVESAALSDGRWEETVDGREFVAAGTPLSGVELRIARPGPDQVGPIEIRSGSLFRHCTSADVHVSEDGWLTTDDLGHMDSDDQLYVVGRRDHFISIRGTK